MNKKVVIGIAAALALAGLLGFVYWWFFGKAAPATPVQNTGTFGSADTATRTPTQTPTQNNNIGAPVQTNSNANAGSTRPLTAGTYTVTSAQGQDMGNFTVAVSETGVYTIQGGPIGGSGTGAVLPSGTYNFTPTAGGAPTMYTVSASGVAGAYTVTPVAVVSQNPTGGTSGGTTIPNVPGVVWTTGTTPTGPTNPTTPTAPTVTPNTPGTVFNPTPVTPVVTSNPTGGVIPSFPTADTGQDDNSALLATVAGGLAVSALSCSGMLAQITGWALAAMGTSAGTGAVSTGTGVVGTSVGLQVPVNDPQANITLTAIAGSTGYTAGTKQGETNRSFLDCMTRALARTALQQITNSVVNWINSGFKGSPSFVQNPTQYLANVADVTAGQFIRSSELAFLCAPFQLQIKIAIAQSYAQRSRAPSCTLTGITNNLQGFMNGNFNDGGWPTFLAFTTMPTNNPYGAFLYGHSRLNFAINTALSQKIQDKLEGRGFLSFQQETNCKIETAAASGANKSSKQQATGDPYNPVVYRNCDLKTATPGSVIADALGATEKSTLDQLSLAKSFDEIIGALITQLMTRTLQGGLSNLSGSKGYSSNFYTPQEQQAQTGAQPLLTQMRNDTIVAQQFGGVMQGSITDIFSAQSQLQGLINCWNAKVASATTTSDGVNTTTPDAAKVAEAQQRANEAQTQFNTLQSQVDAFNTSITKANRAITLLEGLQSRALSAASTDDVASITTDYNNARIDGKIITQTDLLTAQQNRTTGQTQLQILNGQTATNLAQCNAFAVNNTTQTGNNNTNGSAGN